MIFKEIDESNMIEYKVSLPKQNSKWLKSVVAFSNTSGGVLYVGIEDKTKKVIGVSEDRSLLEQKVVNAINESITPRPNIDITFKTIVGKVVMKIEVDKGVNTPYFLIKNNEKEVYVRFGSTDRIATKSKVLELERMYRDESYLKELYLSNGKNVEIAEDEINTFIDSINKESKTDKKINISKLLTWGIIKKKFSKYYATNGYILLTDNTFPNASIKLGEFKGTNRNEILINEEFKGNIIDQYNTVYDYILSRLEDGYKINKVREKKYKIPPVVVREILSNAIIHRDYYDDQKTMISIYSDRIEFLSPGTLYDGITLDEIMNETSKLRNTSIAEIFNFIGITEGWGSGINRANNELLKNNQNPLVIDVTSSTYVNVIIEFNDNKKEILKKFYKTYNILNDIDNFTRREIEKQLNLTEHQARRQIEKWTKEGKIIKIGDKSSTRYIVVEK